MKIKTRWSWTASTAALVAAVGAACGMASQPPAAEKPSGYTRVVDKDDGSLALEIASKTFAPADGKPGPKIHLVGAVHIADKPFYTSLQTMLDAADLVLFEGVKPPGAGAFDATLDEAGKVKATQSRLKFLLSVLEEERGRAGKLPESLQQAVDDAGKRWKTMIASSLTDAWGRPIKYAVAEVEAEGGGQKAVVTSFGPNGTDDEGKADDVRLEGKAAVKKKGEKDTGLQAKMADALGLKFQLDEMDSSKPNWRSSDMSMDELQARFEAAGVEGSQLLKMLDGSSLMGKVASLLLGFVKNSPQLAASLKLTMVDLLGSENAMAAGPAEMKKMMEVILVDRNDVVLKDIKSVMENENRKDIAVFYGAGHLADMEMKLKRDFGYTYEGEQWLEAISVNPKAAGMTPAQAKKMRETMRKQLERQTEAGRVKTEKAKQKKKEEAAQPAEK